MSEHTSQLAPYAGFNVVADWFKHALDAKAGSTVQVKSNVLCFQRLSKMSLQTKTSIQENSFKNTAYWYFDACLGDLNYNILYFKKSVVLEVVYILFSAVSLTFT